MFWPFSVLPPKSLCSAHYENFKKRLDEVIYIAARVQLTKYGHNRPSGLYWTIIGSEIGLAVCNMKTPVEFHKCRISFATRGLFKRTCTYRISNSWAITWVVVFIHVWILVCKIDRWTTQRLICYSCFWRTWFFVDLCGSRRLDNAGGTLILKSLKYTKGLFINYLTLICSHRSLACSLTNSFRILCCA